MDKIKILVVDDEDSTRRLLEIALSNAGYEVNTAGEGQAALKALSEFPAALIVSDIVMPDMDGYTFMKAVKNLPGFRDIPVVISSGKSGMKEYFELEDEIYQPEAFLVKPYKMKDLVDTVERVLQK